MRLSLEGFGGEFEIGKEDLKKEERRGFSSGRFGGSLLEGWYIYIEKREIGRDDGSLGEDFSV